MNVTIKVLSNDSFEIKKVQKFLFKQIKKEFGYGYIPEWHQDIVNMEDYYISPDKMFNVAEEFANKKNYESIYLHTHKTLPGAIEFWKKMGFIIFLDENDELETVHMDKIIHELNMAYHDSEFNYAVEF